MPYGVMMPAQMYSWIAMRHKHFYGVPDDGRGGLAAVRTPSSTHGPTMANLWTWTLPGRAVDFREFRLYDCCPRRMAPARLWSPAPSGRDMPHRPVLIAGAAEGHPIRQMTSPGPTCSRSPVLRRAPSSRWPASPATWTSCRFTTASPMSCRCSWKRGVQRARRHLRLCERRPDSARRSLSAEHHGGLFSEAHVWGPIMKLAPCAIRGDAGARQVPGAASAGHRMGRSR